MSIRKHLVKCSSCECEKYEDCTRAIGGVTPEVDYGRHICNKECDIEFEYFGQRNKEIIKNKELD